MVTACGHSVNFGNPSLTVVDPEDIRIHTRNICRYNGAIYWPLIKHLALCVKLAVNKMPAHMRHYDTSQDASIRLLQAGYCGTHDFHEIYCTDVVSGLKPYLPEYEKIEDTWEDYVHDQLGFPLEDRNDKFVLWVDRRALVLEMTCLGHAGADLVASRYGGSITPTEEQIFKRIDTMDLDRAWYTVWNAFNMGRSIQTVSKRK